MCDGQILIASHIPFLCPCQQGACNSGCRSASEDVLVEMKFVVDSLVALKPSCTFTGSSKILESLYSPDDLYSTLGKFIYALDGDKLVSDGGTSYVETVTAMRAKCPGLAAGIDSSSWCTNEFIAEVSSDLLLRHGKAYVDFTRTGDKCRVSDVSLFAASASHIHRFPPPNVFLTICIDLTFTMTKYS
jgi:hypothetical protein